MNWHVCDGGTRYSLVCLCACVRTLTVTHACPCACMHVHFVVSILRTSSVHAYVHRGVLLVFPTNSRIRSYFDAGIGRDQLYYCFSTSIYVRLILPFVSTYFLLFMLGDTVSEFNPDEYGLSEKGTQSYCAECAYFHVCIRAGESINCATEPGKSINCSNNYFILSSWSAIITSYDGETSSSQFSVTYVRAYKRICKHAWTIMRVFIRHTHT